MAKPPTRKLKVFQAQFGFYDTVVAAASQAAALRAWGTHQNLFASGQAKLTEDPRALSDQLFRGRLRPLLSPFSGSRHRSSKKIQRETGPPSDSSMLRKT